MAHDFSSQNGKLPEEGFFSWINESKKQQIQKMLNEERDRRNEQQQQVFILFWFYLFLYLLRVNLSHLDIRF